MWLVWLAYAATKKRTSNSGSNQGVARHTSTVNVAPAVDQGGKCGHVTARLYNQSNEMLMFNQILCGSAFAYSTPICKRGVFGFWIVLLSLLYITLLQLTTLRTPPKGCNVLIQSSSTFTIASTDRSYMMDCI